MSIYAIAVIFMTQFEPTGMRRRDVLRLTGAVGALAVAGCVGGDDDSDKEAADESEDGETDSTPTPVPTQTPDETDSGEESDTSSEAESSESSGEYDYEEPTAAVEAFIQVFHDADVDGFFALTDDEGELGFAEETVDEEFLTNNAPELQEIELTERDGDTATVEVSLIPPEADAALQNTFELRQADGGWRISNISESEPPSEVPQAAFEVEVQQGTATISHDSGPSISADELYVRGDGVEPVGVWHELAKDADLGPDDEVSRGMSVTVDVEDEYEIQVVWEREDQSATLTSVAGASNSGSDSGGRSESNSGNETVDDYLEETDNYDGTIEDFTGEEAVTVKVGEIGGTDQVFAYDPPAIRIDSGTTVTWEWTGDGAHSVTHEEEKFNSEVMAEQAQFEHIFEQTGTYLYHCLPHKALGMKGAVVVE